MNPGKKTEPEEDNKIKPADLPRIQTNAVNLGLRGVVVLLAWAFRESPFCAWRCSTGCRAGGTAATPERGRPCLAPWRASGGLVASLAGLPARGLWWHGGIRQVPPAILRCPPCRLPSQEERKTPDRQTACRLALLSLCYLSAHRLGKVGKRQQEPKRAVYETGHSDIATVNIGKNPCFPLVLRWCRWRGSNPHTLTSTRF